MECGISLGSLCGVNQDFVCQRSAYFRVPGVFLAGGGLRGAGVGRGFNLGVKKGKPKRVVVGSK